jgi:hypothetical protein
MIIKEYGMEDLEKARKLQKDLLDLHIPTPVLSWGYEIKNTNETLEKGIGKSNSYTRNALNILAWNVGMCEFSLKDTSSFADGYVNIKYSTGTLTDQYSRYTSNATSLNVLVGSNTAAESLESYALPTTTCSLVQLQKYLFSIQLHVY